MTALDEPNFLFIVSWTRPDLYRRFAAHFADISPVRVMFDRRAEERRRRPAAGPAHDRRRSDRRRLRVDRDLDALGFAVVRTPCYEAG